MIKTAINHKIIKEALLIRKVEQTFLDLFARGKLNGTVHTCVGQEFSAVAFAGQLKKTDFVFSNHRCHGHFISFTKDYKGLLAELMGKAKGVCGGVGSSQHLCKDNFFSNGIQGGIVPVAAGFALGNKLKGTDQIGVVYIGDGTLGEGVLYESMNIMSKWDIPLLIVCENNRYAQSTPQSVNLAGDIKSRAEAFGIKTFENNTWEVEDLMNGAKESIQYVRETGKPAFHLVETYRLNAHSKGDDDRAEEEVKHYREKDYLVQFEKSSPAYYQKYTEPIFQQVDQYVAELDQASELSLQDYVQADSIPEPTSWEPLPAVPERMVKRLNQFFKDYMGKEKETIFIGEDVLSPYGGAFKVARDLSAHFPKQVFSTPISEAAIVGISNGLALNSLKPYVEIMFGDFVTLAMDQIINHASKFHHMFLHQVNCPVVIRTPMGGKRGYGPTHSQTLDKFLIGIDHVKTIALTPFADPYPMYESVHQEAHPVIVIENKTDYGKRIGTNRHRNYQYTTRSGPYPFIKIAPISSQADITLIAYGGMASVVHDALLDIFVQTDLKAELLIPTQIHPLDIEPILESVSLTQKVCIIEEGSKTASLGGEILAQIAEKTEVLIKSQRIAALPVPIPSVKSLENQVLPDANRIIQEIKKRWNE